MKILCEFSLWLESLFACLPGYLGIKAREKSWGIRLGRLGTNARIGIGFRALHPSSIFIDNDFQCDRLCSLNASLGGIIRMGRDVSLASNVIINAGYQGIIEIGNDVMIGPNTVLRSSDHGFSSIQIPMRNQPHRSGSIQISSDVWLGANVTVVGGVSIGRGVIVGAGSVVTQSVPDFQIVGGVPARLIRVRAGS